MARKCIFCKRTPPMVKMSNEHVLRAWLKNRIGRNGTSVMWQQAYVDSVSGDIKQMDIMLPHSPFDMKVGDICKPCNEGWLNKEIEKPVEQLLVSMAHGRPACISKAGAKALAVWATKTAYVRALMDKGERVIPDTAFHWIMTHFEPPPFTYVWAMYCGLPHDTWTRHLRFKEFQDGSICHIHTTTIIIGELMFHVAGFSHESTLMNYNVMNEILGKATSNSLIKLWPNPSAYNWPPQQKLHPLRVERLSGLLFSEMQKFDVHEFGG